MCNSVCTSVWRWQIFTSWSLASFPYCVSASIRSTGVATAPVSEQSVQCVCRGGRRIDIDPGFDISECYGRLPTLDYHAVARLDDPGHGLQRRLAIDGPGFWCGRNVIDLFVTGSAWDIARPWQQQARRGERDRQTTPTHPHGRIDPTQPPTKLTRARAASGGAPPRP